MAGMSSGLARTSAIRPRMSNGTTTTAAASAYAVTGLAVSRLDQAREAKCRCLALCSTRVPLLAGGELEGERSPVSGRGPLVCVELPRPFYRTARTVSRHQVPASSHAVHMPVDSLCGYAASAVRCLWTGVCVEKWITLDPGSLPRSGDVRAVSSPVCRKVGKNGD
jgi:hypothetical protein